MMKKLELEYYPIGTKVYQTTPIGEIISYHISWINSEINIKCNGEIGVETKYTISNSYGQTVEKVKSDAIGKRYFLDPKELLNNLVNTL